MKNLLLLTLFSYSLLANAATHINVVGLFANKAVVIVNNGKPQTLSVGQTSPEGVKLLRANSQKASFLVEGKQRELGLGQAANVAGSSSTNTGNANAVTLYLNNEGHFVSEGQVNGKPLKLMMDTGATSVAMNGADAQYAGIDYKRGQMTRVSTANGVAVAYRVSINNIKMGNLTLSDVDGLVLEGGSPPVVLFGMSALNRLSMKIDGSAMTLTKKY